MLCFMSATGMPFMGFHFSAVAFAMSVALSTAFSLDEVERSYEQANNDDDQPERVFKRYDGLVLVSTVCIVTHEEIYYSANVTFKVEFCKCPIQRKTAGKNLIFTVICSHYYYYTGPLAPQHN